MIICDRRGLVLLLVAACVAVASCASNQRQAGTTEPTAPPAASSTGGLPSDFSPASVTFVSPATGWVLGSGPCGTAPCTQLWKTTDGGRTWAQVPAPPLAVSDDSGAAGQVRFANVNDGWAYGSHESDLWSTHDGGAHWSRQSIGGVYALEAAADSVHAVVLLPDRESAFHLKTSPVHHDAWQPSEAVQVGAGPAPQAQLLLHGTAGWMVIVNRTVVGGARLEKGRWLEWTPPCRDASTPVELAASTPSDLVAFCTDGQWNDRPPGERVHVSIDGGSSFRHVPSAVPVQDVTAAAASPDVWVVGSTVSNAQGATEAVLVRTGDGGRTWKTVHREGDANWLDLGFTSPRQGVVISVGTVDRLLMTFDGGQTWAPVATR